MTLTIDRAGRVVIPKPVRDRLRTACRKLSLEILETSEGMTLKPLGQKSSLERIGRFLVYTGEVPEDFDVVKAIADEREARDRKILGM